MSEPIQFFTLPARWGNLSVSPFCAKLHTWLVLADVPFKARTANLQKAPNGKVPYVRHGDREIGDSSRIIEHLTEAFSVTLDDHLTPAQRATGHLVQRVCEEHLYWAVVYQRWYRDEGFAHIKQMLRGLAPAPLRPIVYRVARKKAVTQVIKQGIALHPEPRVCELAAADLAALAELVGDGPYLFGAQPSRFDASLYAVVSSALRIAHPNGVSDAVKQHPALMAYIQRMDARLGHDPSA